MDKKKGWLSLILILAVIIAGTYVCLFGLDENKSGSASAIKQGLDLAGGVSITYEVVGEEEPSPEDMADTVYKLQKRVEVYSTEALVYQEGTKRINIEIPGVSDANTILEELGKPGSLIFADMEGNVVLSGTDIAEAQPATQQNSMGNSEFVVALTMTKEGTEKFAEATRKAAPNQDIIYIIYDDEVVSAPSVQSEITDGQCVIQGMASYEEAESLSSVIRIGGLKLELEELCSKVVGAQLGSKAISTSLKAGAIGMAIVMILMIVIYTIPGVASSIALVIYIILTILLLNGFDIDIINSYNEKVKKRLKFTSSILNIPYDKFAPKDIKGVMHPLGVFDMDAKYKEFITQGAKKYAYKDLEDKIKITVAGVPKKACSELKSLDDFRDNFVFSYNSTDKHFIEYNDNQIEIELTDYKGLKQKVSDKSGAGLYPCEYELGKSLDYIELITDKHSKYSVYKEGE